MSPGAIDKRIVDGLYRSAIEVAQLLARAAMGDKSNIEWTDATWNPTYGCTRVSEGCRNCYAERFVHRFAGEGQRYEGLTVIRGGRPGWTGKIQLAPERLDQPLRWQRPRRIFVNSLSDVFHEGIPFEYVAAIFGVMAMSSRHTFQVLTKRPERAREFFAWLEGKQMADLYKADLCIEHASSHGVEDRLIKRDELSGVVWPLKNVWLGVSVEDQAAADSRIPILLEMPAVVRWISAEPLLGPLDLRDYLKADGMPDRIVTPGSVPVTYTNVVGLDWVIGGGESGPGARGMESEWVSSLHDQCDGSTALFHFKQWGLLSNNPDPKDPTAKKNGGGVKGGRQFLGRTWDDEPGLLNAP